MNKKEIHTHKTGSFQKRPLMHEMQSNKWSSDTFMECSMVNVPDVIQATEAMMEIVQNMVLR